MTEKTQLFLDFTPGLTEQFPEFMDCVRASVYGCGRQFKAVAADLDISPSDLSRRLSNNPHDTAYFPAKRLPDLIAATGDPKPVYWLIEKFCETPEAKKERVMQRLDEVLRVLPGLIAEARK